MFSPGPILLQPVVSNGRVYVVSSGIIYVLRTLDGSQIWQSSMASTLEPLTVRDGLVYVDGSNMIYALHEQGGALAWRQSMDHHSSFSSSDTSMLVAKDGIVYVSKDSGVVQALRASDGKSLWSYAIQEQAVPTEFAYGASVTFASSVSYQQALKTIADLGLQLSIFCPTMWKPQVNGDIFSYHSLSIAANVNSAPLWLNRLKATTGVQEVQAAGVHGCPAERIDDDFSRSHLQQSGMFVQVTFAPTVSYGEALEAVSNLWFRMADPCYEQARAQGTKPTWYSQGQADTFAKTHSFVVATTGLNSIHWSDQLHATAGVVKVDASLKMTC